MNCFSCFFKKSKRISVYPEDENEIKSPNLFPNPQPALVVNITKNNNQYHINNFDQRKSNISDNLSVNSTPKKSALKKKPSYNRFDDPDIELSRFESQFSPN